jgi:uncharacterized protein
MTPLATPNLRALTLTTTERCNLRCKYCYVPADRGRTMAPEVVDTAVDWFADQARQQPRLTLSFFGGEPLLETGIMARTASRLRARCPDQTVRLVTPTNGLLIEGERLEFCRDLGIELAISIDGTEGPALRCYGDGRASTEDLVDRLPGIFSLDPAARVTARVTVTPLNVHCLASNLRALAKLGFRRIAVQPALEEKWSEHAVEEWGRQHARIGTWLVGALSAGLRVPALPWWSAIEKRLVLGKPRSACGAGARVAAVSTDGALWPCYRFVFDQPEAWKLGHVSTGFTNREAMELFASLSPDTCAPESGACSSCPARDGCVHFCPASGALALGDPRRIPEVACRLMRAQVAAIRPYAAVQPSAAKRPPPSRWAAAAIVVAAVTTAASCGGKAETDNQKLGGNDAGTDAVKPGSDAQDDQYVGGVCPVQVDAGPDASSDAVGGFCDYPDATEEYVGGQCPVQIDAAEEYTGGICAQIDDASDEPPPGGLC